MPTTRTQRGALDEFAAQIPSAAGRAKKGGSPAKNYSPYARTPTKQIKSGLSTPTPGASPGMLSGIISMISPFRTYSRARQSAAFGGADEEDQEVLEDDQQQEAHSKDGLERSQDVPIVEEEAQTKPSTLEVPTTTNFLESPSANRSRFVPQSGQATLRSQASSRLSAPLSPSVASSSRTEEPFQGFFKSGARENPPTKGRFSLQDQSTPQYSFQSRPQVDSSPVSRNLDLLARFFAEKRNDAPGGLSEIEVEGCLRLIEESMANGRDLAREFGHDYQSSIDPPTSIPASSRAGSTAPRTSFPASQTSFGSNLFHPGTAARNSSAFSSFLAPKSTSSSSIAASTASRRHRPLYLGPGMGTSQLNRRRTMVPSKSLADSLAQSRRGFLPKSTSDPSNLSGQAGIHAMRDRQHQEDPAPEDGKRRRTVVGVNEEAPHFESSFEHHRNQSSALAKETISAAATQPATASNLKRAAPSPNKATNETKPADSQYVNGVRTTESSTPVRASTRTASAMLDILKDSPPVRPPVQPELVNPYQTSSPLAKLPKRARSQTPSEAARASITTRAKAKEAAAAKVKAEEPKKESVLDLIERTAPKSRRSKATEEEEKQKAAAAAEQAATEARKAEKTEEAKRRIEALSKSREAEKKESATTPSFSFSSPEKTSTSTPSKSATSLVPAQYTASKPKKPSPLSATFQAPDSPSSESENNSPVPATKATFKPFAFSAPVMEGKTTAPFNFGPPAPTAKPVITEKKATPSFSFSPVATTKLAPAPVSTEKNQSPRSEALSLPETDLPKYEFTFSPLASSSGSEAIKKEVSAMAEANLDKFDFVFDTSSPTDKVEEKAAPSFSFSSKPAAPSTPLSAPTDPPSSSEETPSNSLLGEGEGEESETLLFSTRSKLWKFDFPTSTWKDLGISLFKIKENNETSKRRILVRNEANGKVTVNFNFYASIKVTREKNVVSFLGFEGKEPVQFRVKVKTEEGADELKVKVEEAATV